MSMYPAGSSQQKWMQGSTEQWPPPNGPFGGFRGPSSYPPPPPMPSDYQYGQRAWKSGSWMFAPGAGGGPFGNGPDAQRDGWRPYPGFGRPPRNQGSSDYWATELKENPLGLENMHIRADDQAKENEPPIQGSSESQPQENQNFVWVPALHDGTNRIGRSPHPRAGSRSSSHPPLSRNQQRSGNAEHPEPPSTTHPHPRQPSPTKPMYDTTGHSGNHDPQASIYDVPQYQRTRPSSAAAYHHYYRPEPRRKSDEYIGYEGPLSGRSSVPADRYPSYPEAFGLRSSADPSAQHRHRLAQNVMGGRSVQRSQTLPVNFSIPEKRQVNGPCAPDMSQSTESMEEYEEQKKEMEKSKERVRKWLKQNIVAAGRATPVKRQTADGYEHLRSPNREQVAREPPIHGRQQHYQGYSRDDIIRRDTLGRNHSLPAGFAPGAGHVTEMGNITEEPTDIHSHTLVEEASSSGDTEDDDDAVSEKFRPGLHRQKTPLPGQRPTLERNDTLRVEGDRTYHHHTLPSPKSLHPSSGQSSRIPSARSSYERVGEGGRVSTPNRHHLSPASSQQFHSAMSYNTPPRTPNRPDYMYRQDDSRVPSSAPPAIRGHGATYAAPNTAAEPSPLRHSDRSAPRTGSAQPSQGTFQTPPHLQYLYRPPASPSPQARSAAGPSASTSHLSLQAQYGHGMSSAEKNLPPRPSRSPSPLPPSAVPQSAGGHHAASRSQHGTAVRQGEQPQDHSSARSAHGHGHGSSPLAQRAPLAGSGRHVRQGFWNRRGDHLTQDGYVVMCPPGRNYPQDLADYPDLGFMDHLGNRVMKTPDRCKELPESIPVNGRPPKRPYDTFLNYVMI